NMTWRDEGDATWQAKVCGDLPPKAPAKPKPVRRSARITPQETVDRLNKARSAKGKAARDALAPAIRELAALGVLRANIARAVDISPATVDRIGKEHGIAIPLQPRKGTRQARRNAEVREDCQGVHLQCSACPAHTHWPLRAREHLPTGSGRTSMAGATASS